MPQYSKPATYTSKIEKELERLRISKTSVLVINLGKDKYSLADGNRSVNGRGSALMRVLKKMPIGAGYSKFFEGFNKAEGIQSFSSRRLVISTR